MLAHKVCITARSVLIIRPANIWNEENIISSETPHTRLVHLDVEGTSEELLRQLSYAIKNQLVASKAPY